MKNADIKPTMKTSVEKTQLKQRATLRYPE